MRAGKFANANFLRWIASFAWTRLGLVPFMPHLSPPRASMHDFFNRQEAEINASQQTSHAVSVDI
jgi:hypothetical protein